MNKELLEQKIEMKERNGLSATPEYIELLVGYFNELSPEQVEAMESFEKESISKLLYRVGPHRNTSRDLLEKCLTCGISLIEEYRQSMGKQFPPQKEVRDTFFYQIAYINKLISDYCSGCREGKLPGYDIQKAMTSTEFSRENVEMRLCELERLFRDCIVLLQNDKRDSLLTAYCFIAFHNANLCD